MGLDMYLSAKRYTGKYHNPELAKAIRDALGITFTTNNLDTTEVKLEAAYWRKANQIHKWFVDNVQEGEDDCGHYYVSREKLGELRALCMRIQGNHELASQLLPSQAGFFFGSVDYDEGYFRDIEDTIAQINACLEAFNEDWNFEYHSSW